MKLLITADWHLRKDKPRCRLDEHWMLTQQNVLDSIIDIFNEEEADYLYIVGDLFHYPVVQPEIENMVIKTLYPIRKKVFILAGNHDLPYHSYENVGRSSYGVIKNYFKESGFHFGKQITKDNMTGGQFTGIHILVWPGKKPPMADGCLPQEVCEMLNNYKYIFTGDYHRNFLYNDPDGQRLINPGCITRQAADFKDYQPICYTVDIEENIIEAHNLPDTTDVVTDEYLRKEEERNERIEGFIELIAQKGNVSLDFRANLAAKYDKIEPDVKEILQEVLEEI